MTIDQTGTTINPISNIDGLLLQANLTEEPNSKVEIGEKSDTPGILVLENTIQAMVLLKVASPQDNMENTNPGLMVYDTVNWRFSMVLFGGFGDLRI